MYQTKCFEKRHVDLLLTCEKRKRQNVLFKDFSTFMYDHTLFLGRKNFYRYCLQAFRTEEILKRKVTLKSILDIWLRRLKKVNILNSKILKEK